MFINIKDIIFLCYINDLYLLLILIIFNVFKINILLYYPY